MEKFDIFEQNLGYFYTFFIITFLASILTYNTSFVKIKKKICRVDFALALGP